MSRLDPIFFFLLGTLVFSHLIFAETLEVPLDTRSWKVGYEEHKEGHWLRQYVLENESTENWSELVTVEYFPGLQGRLSAAEFVQGVRNLIFEQCALGDWEILREASREITYSWSVRLCPNFADQIEIARVIVTEEGIHVLHYTVKGRQMEADERKKWIGLLEKARVLKAQSQ